MKIETLTPARSTATIFVPDAMETMNPSGMSSDVPPRLVEGKESLAISSDVALLQGELVQLVEDLYFHWAAVDWTGDARGAQLFPVLVDTSYFRQKAAQNASFAAQERVQLAQSLLVAFEIEPLEDGMGHAAEKIISEALRSPQDRQVLDWFKGFCLEATRPNFAASVLRCLARRPNPGTTSWRTDLVRSALDMEDAEIRDAAVQAAEFWGGQDIRNVLETHKEPLQWLRNYVRDVIEDLGE